MSDDKRIIFSGSNKIHARHSSHRCADIHSGGYDPLSERVVPHGHIIYSDVSGGNWQEVAKMILTIECVIGCFVFGIVIIGSVLADKIFWLQEYAPSVQERFLSSHPEYRPADKKEAALKIITKKTIVSLLFILLLLFMVRIAGARDFITGSCYCYIIWFTVNWFDVIVLDIGILANWKKVRLPGTEDMDKEYRSNNRKSIIDGLIGMAIGIVIAIIVGGLTALLF